MINLWMFNCYEKSFTPYWAALADKKYVHRHKIGRQPNRQSKVMQDPRARNFMRVIRKAILMKTYWFHTGVILCTI